MSPTTKLASKLIIVEYRRCNQRIHVKTHHNPLPQTGESAEIERLLLHRAIAASVDGVTIGRASGAQFPLIYANASFYQMTGYEPGEVMGNDCRFLQGALRDQPGLETLRSALKEGAAATVLLRNFRKDGSWFWNELSVSPVLDEHGQLTHYVGIQHDVTERETRKLAMAELNKTLAERSIALELSNDSLRSFSSSASHDLRAPLASIKGFCAALRKSIGASQPTRSEHYMARIEANADRMGNLIEALLELAKSTTGELKVQTCDLSQMAQEIVSVEMLSSPGREVQVNIEPKLVAQGDPTLLRSVLQNLIGNALKYSSKTPGATVSFGREASESDEPRFFVRDNGAGFDMKYADKLFGAFQRLHSESDFPGTGVGLATVRRVITRHGGVVTAESEPGHGATFFFTIGVPHVFGIDA